VKHVLQGKIVVPCSIRKSASGSRVTISHVPTGDTQEEIFFALNCKAYHIQSVYTASKEREAQPK
jgi:hypothetical protein